MKCFHINTLMEHFEYMHMPNILISQPFMDDYDILCKTKDGFVFMEIRKGIYGLPQTGILANELLKKQLPNFGYYRVPHSPSLLKNHTKPI